MKFSTGLLLQILGSAGQLFNAMGTVIPPKYQILVAGLLGAAQTIVGAVQHMSDPPGSAASK